MNFALNRCRRRADLAEELVEEAWAEDHRNAMAAHTAENLICEFAELAKVFRYAWEVVQKQLFDETVDDIDGLFRVFLRAVEQSIVAANRVKELVELVVGNGYAVEQASDITLTVYVLEQLRLEIQKRWPIPDPGVIAESTAARDLSEYRSAEDWLRESQGSGTQESH